MHTTFLFPQRALILLALLTSLGWAGCNNSLSTEADKPAPEKIAVSETPAKNVAEAALLKTILQKVAANEISPNTFSAKASVESSDGTNNLPNAAVNIRILKDAVIWASISTDFGIKIEVARAYITPDSVKFMNRLTKEYVAKDIGYLSRLVRYPLDFATLQNVLLGRRLDSATPTSVVPTNNDGYALTGTRHSATVNTYVERRPNHRGAHRVGRYHPKPPHDGCASRFPPARR